MLGGPRDTSPGPLLTLSLVPALCAAEAYVSSMLFCLGIFLSFYVLTLLIACWESCR